MASPTTWSYLAGDALASTRIAGGNVLLDWAMHAPDANTLGLWHMDEAAWLVGQPSCLDASGNGKHMTVAGTTPNTFANSWMNRGGNLTTGDNDGLTQASIGPASPGDYTVESWLYFPSDISQQFHMGLLRTHSGLWEWFGVGILNHRPNGVGVRYGYQVTYGLIPNPTTLTWHHFAITVNGTTNEAKYYYDGVLKATKTPTSGGLWGGQFNIGYGSLSRIKADEARFSNIIRYMADFTPIRYPASGTWTVAATRAENNVLPGVLTVTLAEALPAGTSLKAKLLGTLGGDTDWQTLSGSGTIYTYDFTGETADNWYPAAQLFAGGTLNINTPTVVDATLVWTAPSGYVFRPWLYPSRPIGGL